LIGYFFVMVSDMIVSVDHELGYLVKLILGDYLGHPEFYRLLLSQWQLLQALKIPELNDKERIVQKIGLTDNAFSSCLRS
jgi:hypothetical protein